MVPFICQEKEIMYIRSNKSSKLLSANFDKFSFLELKQIFYSNTYPSNSTYLLYKVS